MPPYFALGWFITWFSHNVQQLDQISRLFDLFMASHPLMALYVVAQVMMVSSEMFLRRFYLSPQAAQHILLPQAAVLSRAGRQVEVQGVAEQLHRMIISNLCCASPDVALRDSSGGSSSHGGEHEEYLSFVPATAAFELGQIVLLALKHGGKVCTSTLCHSCNPGCCVPM